MYLNIKGKTHIYVYNINVDNYYMKMFILLVRGQLQNWCGDAPFFVYIVYETRPNIWLGEATQIGQMFIHVPIYMYVEKSNFKHSATEF